MSLKHVQDGAGQIEDGSEGGEHNFISLETPKCHNTAM